MLWDLLFIAVLQRRFNLLVCPVLSLYHLYTLSKQIGFPSVSVHAEHHHQPHRARLLVDDSSKILSGVRGDSCSKQQQQQQNKSDTVKMCFLL